MPQLTFERVEKKYLLTPAQLDALRCRNGNLPIQLCHTDTQEGIL